MAATNNLNYLPYPPSPVEARCYYYGIPSRPLLVARSSITIWLEPTGPEAYLFPKETTPIGSHPLQAIWEAEVGPAMVGYLDSQGVKWTSLDPVRMGHSGKPSPPVIIWIGVVPGSLSAEKGVEVAAHCRSILVSHAITDIHVEIRESEVIRSAKMYKPPSAFNPIAWAKEPFSTALGLPICAEVTPSTKGTGGFFISDPRYPGKIYLVTARHVVFCPDVNPNNLYEYHNSSQPRRNVLLLGDADIEEHITAINFSICDTHKTVKYLQTELERAKLRSEEEAESMLERKRLPLQLKDEQEAIELLETFLADVIKDWREPNECVLGHVVLSPPIGVGVGDEGFTEDWAVIEIDASKIDSTNFVGNVINLGATTDICTISAWMRPHHDSSSSFEYPEDGLLKFHDTIPDEEMGKPTSNPNTPNRNNNPCIMVIKHGCASGLTVGRLNTVRSFTRYYFEGQPGQTSKEVVVLPRNSKSGAFSDSGDSGSAVVDGTGRLAGLLTGGAGVTEALDCTYLTSINFLLKRMSEYGLRTNLYPSFNT